MVAYGCLWFVPRRGEPVCAAVLRVYGKDLAEFLLVATEKHSHRLGHARVLMAALEDFLRSIGVSVTCLPSSVIMVGL